MREAAETFNDKVADSAEEIVTDPPAEGPWYRSHQ